MVVTIKGADGKTRCKWCDVDAMYIEYHDTEWGFPVDDDYKLFEKICLEGFQSGLSWRTILVKRENFRSAFHDFNFNKVARFTQRDVTRLLKDASIVRHRGKIEAVINNAKRALEMVKQEGSLATYFWRYEAEDKKPSKSQIASTSIESIALAKDLKKLGWKFVGPTTAYAFMQAMGMVNDHVVKCMSWKKVESARKKFRRP